MNEHGRGGTPSGFEGRHNSGTTRARRPFVLLRPPETDLNNAMAIINANHNHK